MMSRWLTGAGLALLGAKVMAQMGPASPFTPPPLPPPVPVPAGVTVPQPTDDQRWRWRLGVGGTLSSGNTESSRVNVNADGERLRGPSRWVFNARLLHARDANGLVGEQVAAYTRYDKDRTERVFLFNQGSVLRDRPANLSARVAAGSGVGYHVSKDEDARWDVTLGLGYSVDRYLRPTEVRGDVRSSLDRVELLLGENSSHQLTRTTRLKQQLLLTPALNDGPFRAEWKGGVAVAMTETLHLTVDVTVRYNADPGTDLKKTDTLLITGVSMSLD